MNNSEQDRILTANSIIDNYCETLKQKLVDDIALYKRNNPGWEFDHLELKMTEDGADTKYRLQPKFVKPKQ